MEEFYIIVLLFIWVFIGGVIGALIAPFRGQSEGAGAVLGAIFGPVGWAIILCMQDKRLRCSECMGVIHPKARRCMHCGERFEEAEK